MKTTKQIVEDEDIRVTDGILLVQSKSGTHKIQKVIVQAKPGKRKNQVKCRFLKYENEKRTLPSKIPVLIRNRKTPTSNKIPLFIKNPTQTSKTEIFESFDGEEDESEKKYSVKEVQSLAHAESKFKNFSLETIQYEIPVVEHSSREDSLSKDNVRVVSDTKDINVSEESKKLSSFHTFFSIQGTPKDIPLRAFADTSPPTSDANSVECEEIFRNVTDDTSGIHSATDESSIQVIPKLKPTTIVMTQYKSNLPSPFEEGKFQETEDEEFDLGDESSTEIQRYIDSGLRPLKSDESRLYLDPLLYKRKRTAHKTIESDDVQPLLEEIPSSVFQKVKKPKKKKPPEEIIKQPSDTLSKGDFTPSEHESVPSETIDTEPLKKLQEFEDVTFIIKAEEIEEPKRDFCVHVKDPPEGEATDFSSPSEEFRSKEMKSNSVFKFFKKNLCVHTVDPPGSDYSPTSCEDSTKGEHNTEKKEVFKLFKNNLCAHTVDPPGSDYSPASSHLSEICSYEDSGNEENETEKKEVFKVTAPYAGEFPSPKRSYNGTVEISGKTEATTSHVEEFLSTTPECRSENITVETREATKKEAFKVTASHVRDILPPRSGPGSLSQNILEESETVKKENFEATVSSLRSGPDPELQNATSEIMKEKGFKVTASPTGIPPSPKSAWRTSKSTITSQRNASILLESNRERRRSKYKNLKKKREYNNSREQFSHLSPSSSGVILTNNREEKRPKNRILTKKRNVLRDKQVDLSSISSSSLNKE